jgi:heme A synthase
MDPTALQDAGVGAVGGFLIALLVLYRLVQPSDAAETRVPMVRRWRIVGLSTLLGALLVWAYGLIRSPSLPFDVAVGAVGGLFIALLILWRIGSSDEAYHRITTVRRWGIIGIGVVLGAALMGVYGYIR